MMFSKMFGRFLGCSREDTGRKEKVHQRVVVVGTEQEDPTEAWLASNGMTLGRLFCRALWAMGVGVSALHYCSTLVPPHMEAGLLRDCDIFFEHRQTPESLKYVLNNHPSPDITEAFIVTVLGHLCFRHLATSNYNVDTSCRLSLSARFFALMLAKNCFTRDLLSKYQSIDWAAGIPPPPEFWPELVPRMPADGSSITSGTADSWSSPSGRFSFGFYPTSQGFAIGVWLQTSPEKTIIWTANQDNPHLTGGSIRLSFDGRLLWSAAGGQEKVISNPPEPASGAAMLNSGNFVLLNSARRVVWSTFAIPTNTIVPGQTLQPNSQLISSSSENNPLTGKFRLTNQNDGNLVLYPMHTTNTADDAYWDSGTFQIGFLLTLNLADNGVLFLSGNNSAFTKNLTQSTTSQKPSVEIYYRAVIDVDGILRVYYHSLTKNVSWETGIEWAALTDKCLVKGVCGLNSYCSLLDGVNGEQSCLCPSGFSFVDSNQRTLGCTKELHRR
ncbi:hypothetical protein J5N97_012071 [Dioscorea zingiberensis]|uniref:Bulb-type lectin domain-containing protein n=1 Tax=Dioscorea zingiberensis TaxID=325984 RepID=A0A9D5CP54_9LILI|nr:hypothetical protein J5N97_012071 [Dioscorea zingiberensis]